MNALPPIPVNAWIIQSKEEADNILLHGGKIVILSEDVPDYLNSPQYGNSCLMANCLLPNYEAVSYYIEGDPQTFCRVHQQMLMEPENMVYFITLISAMINNIPLGFVFGTEEIEVASTVNLLNFFQMSFGVHLGHNYPFMEEPPVSGFMDRNFVPSNVSLLYLNNLLTPQEFLYLYPLEVKITPECLNKLMIELRPLVNDTSSIVAYEAYFDNMRNQIRGANRVLVDPMVML